MAKKVVIILRRNLPRIGARLSRVFVYACVLVSIVLVGIVGLVDLVDPRPSVGHGLNHLKLTSKVCTRAYCNVLACIIERYNPADDGQLWKY